MFTVNNLRKDWVAYTTLARREIRRFTRIWIQTLIPPMVTTSLYFLIFGRLIGERIGTIDGIPYGEFIAPGLIMMAMLTNAYANVSSSFFSTKHHKNIEEQLVSSMPDALIILGYITGGVLRGLCVGAIVSTVALFFTSLHIAHIIPFIIITLLTTIIFSLAGFLNGLYAKNFDDVSIVPTFILTPLTYLGGVFYSLSMLDPLWQTIAHGNPLLYVINGFRYAMLGITDVDFTTTAGALALASIGLFSTALVLMKKSQRLRK